jgi:hypothetical protein
MEKKYRIKNLGTERCENIDTLYIIELINCEGEEVLIDQQISCGETFVVSWKMSTGSLFIESPVISCKPLCSLVSCYIEGDVSRSLKPGDLLQSKVF